MNTGFKCGNKNIKKNFSVTKTFRTYVANETNNDIQAGSYQSDKVSM